MSVARFQPEVIAVFLAIMIACFCPTIAQETTQPQNWLTFEKGIVVAHESVEIAAQETGILKELTVRESSFVEKNQVIGRLDSETADLEKQLAGLQLQVANSEASDLSDIRLSESLVAETELQLESAIELQNKGGTGDADVRQKRISVEQAKARLAQSKSAKVQKDVRAKIAQSTFSLSERKIERLKLTSPIVGAVNRVDHFPGEWVTSGTPIVKIIRMDEMRIDFFLDSNQISPTKLVGQRVVVRLNQQSGKPLEFAGKVSGFAPEVSPSGIVRMHATIPNRKLGDHWVMLQGMHVEVLVSPPTS